MSAEALAYLEEHLGVRGRQKQRLGEVFTGLPLVDEMLGHLPEAVWFNPDLKWLDPAAGMGNFLIKSFTGGSGYVGLDRGLKDRIPDDEKRRRRRRRWQKRR